MEVAVAPARSSGGQYRHPTVSDPVEDPGGVEEAEVPGGPLAPAGHEVQARGETPVDEPSQEAQHGQDGHPNGGKVGRDANPSEMINLPKSCLKVFKSQQKGESEASSLNS